MKNSTIRIIKENKPACKLTTRLDLRPLANPEPVQLRAYSEVWRRLLTCPDQEPETEVER